MRLTRFKLAFLSYVLFDLLIGGHCGGLLPLALAQSAQAVGNITSAATTCSITAVPTNCVVLQLDAASGAASIDISGTWAATLQIEAFGGVTWAAINCTPPNSTTAVSSTTANGVWQCNVAGFSAIRIRASAYSSGTAAVVINSAHASAKSGGGAVYASGLGTNNVIPKGNGSGQLADSSCTDNGTTVACTELFIPNASSSATVIGGIGTASNGSGLNFQAAQIQFLQSANRMGAFAALDFSLATNARISWSNTSNDALGSTTDTFFGKRSAANFRYGAADVNGVPVAQTLSVQNAITGSNLVGSQFTIAGPLGTGTGLPAPVVIQGADASVATGATAQTEINRLVSADTKNLTSGAASTLLSIPLATLQTTGGLLSIHMEATDGTNQCTLDDLVTYSAENSAGVFVVNTSKMGTGSTACTATKSLTATYAVTSANPALLQVTPTLTGITATRFTAVYSVMHGGMTQPTL